jgi:hypothetical protein
MTAPSSTFQPPDAARWQACVRLSLDRFPIPFWVTALLLGLVVLVEQVMERAVLAPMPAEITAGLVGRRLALPVLTVYMLLALRILKTSALPRLARLRAAVRIDDDAYAQHVQRILYTSPRAELLLLLLSLALVLAWFVVLRLPFPLLAGIYLPANALQASLAIIAYTIFGWAGLTLVYSTTHFGFGLGALAQQPLQVNVFDPDNLLPFGALSLRHSLTVAVTILLLIIPLGRPTEPEEYAVILLATLASLSALILPLWGVHRQMGRARDAAAARIGEELGSCQERLMAETELDLAAATDLANRTEKLMALRTTMYKSPSWPFRNASSVFRVSLAALSPLIYFILSEMLRTYLLPLLGIGG